MYKEAQQSVEKKDWSRVSQIASELDIDITDVEEDDSVFLEETIKVCILISMLAKASIQSFII